MPTETLWTPHLPLHTTPIGFTHTHMNLHKGLKKGHSPQRQILWQQIERELSL